MEREHVGPSHTLIRPATEADARLIAELHVAAWEETYAELQVPQSLLTHYPIAVRTDMWHRILSTPIDEGGQDAVIAEDRHGPIGFAACCVQRSVELSAQGYTGEISRIYVLRAAQGQRAGSILMAESAKRLLACGHNAASLWVLRQNAGAHRFCEKLGGVKVGARSEQRYEVTLHEIAFGWRSLSSLLHAARRPHSS